MNVPYVRGRVAKQAHVGIPEGTVEEEYARKGFFGEYAHLYRSEPPTAWTRIVGPLKPRAFAPRPAFLKDYCEERRPLLMNEDVRVYRFGLRAPMAYWFRNADAEEVFFVHSGSGRLETDFGPVDYAEGDYISVPRGTVYRWLPDADAGGHGTQLLLVESFGEVRFPDMRDKGMLGEHALFDPAVVRVPTPEPSTVSHPAHGAREFELRILRAGELTSVFYPFPPINTVGWKGTLSVTQLNVRDIRPLSCDRYHLPPSAHSTFIAPGFVICTFLPRPLENGDPTALKVPFYHSNIDFDEVIFYHAGEFFSREGISPGMITFHPQGIHHGPQPAAVKRSVDAQRTEEVAVMIDTKRPLKVAPAAQEAELPDYWKSWMSKKES